MREIAATEIVARFSPRDRRSLDPDYWWSNAVRGALGTALHFTLCRVRATPCTSCPERPNCDFAALFQPERHPQDERHGPRYRLAPWLLHAEIQEGHLVVLLRLFGTAVPHAWRWRVALELAAARGIGPGRPAFLPAAPVVSREASLRDLLPPSPDPEGPLLVRFRSPLRLVADGAPTVTAPPFESLFLAAQRRLHLAELCWTNGTTSTRVDPRPRPSEVPLLGHVVSWQDFPRFSRRQQRPMRLGGVVGEATYGGGWARFWSVLATAAVLHTGKLTTMGFGRIEFSSA